MKTKFILTVIISFLTFACYSQNNDTSLKLNLDFENIQNCQPQDWHITIQKNYSISLDSITVKSGKYSIAIESTGDSPLLQPITLFLPHNYEGRRITLSGYIKTENISGGHAGLWMRIDPKIAFDNMSNNGVTGTTDWKKYEITFDLKPAKTKNIVLGGILVGKGKMWLDDLQITIDGKDITDSKIYEREILPAEKDKEYDSGSNIAITFSKTDNSNISSTDKSLIDNLELLGKLWGFLKYHHPEIAKGNYNWDYELFRILPEYLKITDNDRKRDEFLLKWIEKYGEIPECKTCKETSLEAFLKPDLSWFDNNSISPNLKQKIKTIYMNRTQGSQFYIELNEHTGNPTFLNENKYSDMHYPDTGFRLLALYRYWNMVHYFFPYKYLTDKNWDEVLKEYIPRFISARTGLEYELAVLQLVGEVNDTHANLWEGCYEIWELKGNWQAPFKIRLIENKWVVTDYYKPELQEIAGLRTGDIITHINGEKIESVVDSIKKYYPASNEAVRMRDIEMDLLRSSNKKITINYISSNQPKEKELILYERNYLDIYKTDNSICYKLLDNNIGYITLKSIKEKDIAAIKNKFINTKGIIIDIRNYPSYFVPYLLGSYFISNTRPFVKTTIGNIDNLGEFTFSSNLDIPNSEEHYKGKLVVIVNEETQSQAEFTAMAFRAGDNTTIIGSTTAGADGNVSQIYLPGGLMTYISGIGVYYPDGRQTQRIGIIPDIEVKPTIKGISEGRDELLEKAIEIISNNN